MRSIPSVLALVLLATVGAAAPAHAEDQRTKLALDQVAVERAPADSLTGHAVIRTPLPEFARTSEDAAPTALFVVELAPPCRADIRVTTRAVRSRRSPRRQVYAATDGDDGTLAKDWRPRSPWRLTEEPADDGISLFGIRVIPVGAKRFLHIRVSALYDPSCPDVDRREGVVVDGLKRALRTARHEGR